MPSQTVGDVRTLVIRRAGAKRRVAMLGSDAALVDGLRANGCEVMADPGSLDELGAFAPEVVVAFDGFALAGGAEAFALLARVAPGAELVFSFANAGAASAALAAITGADPARALAEREVQRWLSSAGYVVSSRDVVVVPHVSTGLSADTESALRQLLEQLNPDAAADRLLLRAKREGLPPSVVERARGLLSVVVSAPRDAVPALEGTLASLLGQHQRPMELLVSSPLSLDATDQVFEKARARAGITCVAVSSLSSDWAARTNAGLAAAQGQYVACVEAGDLFSPFHFSNLVRRLADGTKAWALGAAQGGLPDSFSVSTWLSKGATQRQAIVIDRERVATVPLAFAEGVHGAEGIRFARLAALFEPAWANGTVSVQTPSRPPVDLEALRSAMRARPLRMLTTLSEQLKPPPTSSVRDALQARLKELIKR